MKMKLFSLAALCLIGIGTPAGATNPFSDVSPSDWSYQAVSELAARGIAVGFPDGTFSGERALTRYELAQIIARLLARENTLSAEDRAAVQKLSGAYAKELKTLGVSVSELEKKTGKITFFGDARMYYEGSQGGAKEEKFTSRIQLQIHGAINESTYAHGVLVGTTDLRGSSDDPDDNNVSMERFFVHHDFGRVGVTMGRYGLKMGQQADGWLTTNAFDGAEVKATVGKDATVAVGYGRYSDVYDEVSYTFDGKHYSLDTDYKKTGLWFMQARGKLGAANVGIDFFRSGEFTVTYKPKNLSEKGRHTVLGINFLAPISKWRVFGDYYYDFTKNMTMDFRTSARHDQHGQIWCLGIGYGEKDLEKPGSVELNLSYFKVKGGLYEQGMTSVDVPSVDYLLNENGRFFFATADVVIAKNTYISGEYAFGVRKGEHVYNEEYSNSWAFAINYEF